VKPSADDEGISPPPRPLWQWALFLVVLFLLAAPLVLTVMALFT
jgi:hypothetical protein